MMQAQLRQFKALRALQEHRSRSTSSLGGAASHRDLREGAETDAGDERVPDRVGEQWAVAWSEC